MSQPVTDPSIASGNRLRRWLLLATSIGLMIAGRVIDASPELVESGSRELFGGTLFKVGMVLGLAWLASPQLERLGWQRLRGTGLAIIVVIGVLTAIRPRLGGLAAGIVIGGILVLSVLGWVRGVIFNDTPKATINAKSRKIEKNPTKR